MYNLLLPQDSAMVVVVMLACCEVRGRIHVVLAMMESACQETLYNVSVPADCV